MKQYSLLLILSCLSMLFCKPAAGIANSPETCRATLSGDFLVLENSEIRRTYLWNEGHLVTRSMTDKGDGKTWEMQASAPDLLIPGGTPEISAGNLKTRWVEANPAHAAHLEAVVRVSLDDLELKRIFRIYPDCPAIACDIWMRGRPGPGWEPIQLNENVLRGFETKASYVGEGEAWRQEVPVIERLSLPGRHWRLTAVEFFDVTDVRNTLLREESILAYEHHANELRGNLLFLDPLFGDQGFFILKEAFPSNVQLAYPGYDFLCRVEDFRVVGIGVEPWELEPDEWIRAHSFVTGITRGGELGKLQALRTYQEKVFPHNPTRTDMILMNTWGDRSRGRNLNEAHCIEELEACKRLGITHYQLDAGWQKSLEIGHPDFLRVDERKFPNGLGPVVDKAEELGIEFCLWTDPRENHSYSHYNLFAGRLADLYTQYGIRTFKLDGIVMRNKTAEMRVRRMLDSIMNLTGNQAIFNLDITAGRRYGYFTFYRYGNYFLENRYTDLNKYWYPHWTLRNLWMLSHYVPPHRLQVEFLNIWRNVERYPEDDPLAPAKVPFEYCFATTMMGQPLCWFEAINLPEEGFEIAPVVKRYRELMSDIHAGQIFPIGEEPQGNSWTGFQSIADENTGFILVFREWNEEGSADLETWLPPGRKVNLTSLLGQGKNFSATVSAEGRLMFSLPDKFNYALYRYQVR